MSTGKKAWQSFSLQILFWIISIQPSCIRHHIIWKSWSWSWVDQGNPWGFIKEMHQLYFIWYFNKNLLGVFYKTHLTVSFFLNLFLNLHKWTCGYGRHQELLQPGNGPQQVLQQPGDDGDARREEHLGSGDLWLE